MKESPKIHCRCRKIWHFLWNDNSLWSWLANVLVAFLVIRFIAYPVLGLLLGTGYPIVAVVSESMEHGLHNNILCGQQLPEFYESFENYWKICGGWYEKNGIQKKEFERFPFRDGFMKGDVIILWRANENNLNIGSILVFQGNKKYPIIHRVVKIWNEQGTQYYQTKGDHNSDSITGTYGETRVAESRLVGKGIFRIPYLGWLKIVFVDAVKPFGIKIER